MSALVADLLAGSHRALARLLTYIENEHPQAQPALAALYPHTGRAHRIGVTGAPGTGKSSLVSSLARTYRAAGQTVGIIAVDPTSPFSGGAILGDRIRMRDLAGDRGVFIRSMATRGSLGGLARATGDAVCALDAAGFDVVLIETVGAGQSEIDIVRQAHTTLVIEAPGLGDEVQAIKAGILEIADILVVNKADIPGAQSTVRALRTLLDLGSNRPPAGLHHGLPEQDSRQPAADHYPDEWQTPIVETVATEGQGINALWQTIQAHLVYLRESDQLRLRERQRQEIELQSRLQAVLFRQIMERIDPALWQAMLDQVAARELAPTDAVERLLQTVGLAD